MVNLIDRLTSDEGGTYDVTDPGDLADWLTTGGIPEETHTGTPPPIGPGSVARSLPLASRLAGVTAFEVGRSDIGRDVTRDLAGSDDGDEPGIGGVSPRALLSVVGVLVVIYTLGQLFTFGINIGGE
jgi:hypothetical protein